MVGVDIFILVFDVVGNEVVSKEITILLFTTVVHEMSDGGVCLRLWIVLFSRSYV